MKLNKEKFKENFLKLLNSPQEHVTDPLFKVYNQYFNCDCSNEVDFSCFTLEEAEQALDDLYVYAPIEMFEEHNWDTCDCDENKGNSLHKFLEVNVFFWGTLKDLKPKRNDSDYI